MADILTTGRSTASILSYAKPFQSQQLPQAAEMTEQQKVEQVLGESVTLSGKYYITSSGRYYSISGDYLVTVPAYEWNKSWMENSYAGEELRSAYTNYQIAAGGAREFINEMMKSNPEYFDPSYKPSQPTGGSIVYIGGGQQYWSGGSLISQSMPTSPQISKEMISQTIKTVSGDILSIVESETKTYKSPSGSYYTLIGETLYPVKAETIGGRLYFSSMKPPTESEQKFMELSATKGLTPSQMWERGVLGIETGLNYNPFSGEFYKIRNVPLTAAQIEQQRVDAVTREIALRPDVSFLYGFTHPQVILQYGEALGGKPLIEIEKNILQQKTDWLKNLEYHPEQAVYDVKNIWVTGLGFAALFFIPYIGPAVITGIGAGLSFVGTYKLAEEALKGNPPSYENLLTIGGGVGLATLGVYGLEPAFQNIQEFGIKGITTQKISKYIQWSEPQEEIRIISKEGRIVAPNLPEARGISDEFAKIKSIQQGKLFGKFPIAVRVGEGIAITTDYQRFVTDLSEGITKTGMNIIPDEFVPIPKLMQWRTSILGMITSYDYTAPTSFVESISFGYPIKTGETFLTTGVARTFTALDRSISFDYTKVLSTSKILSEVRIEQEGLKIGGRPYEIVKNTIGSTGKIYIATSGEFENFEEYLKTISGEFGKEKFVTSFIGTEKEPRVIFFTPEEYADYLEKTGQINIVRGPMKGTLAQYSTKGNILSIAEKTRIGSAIIEIESGDWLDKMLKAHELTHFEQSKSIFWKIEWGIEGALGYNKGGLAYKYSPSEIQARFAESPQTIFDTTVQVPKGWLGTFKGVSSVITLQPVITSASGGGSSGMTIIKPPSETLSLAGLGGTSMPPISEYRNDLFEGLRIFGLTGGLLSGERQMTTKDSQMIQRFRITQNIWSETKQLQPQETKQQQKIRQTEGLGILQFLGQAQAQRQSQEQSQQQQQLLLQLQQSMQMVAPPQTPLKITEEPPTTFRLPKFEFPESQRKNQMKILLKENLVSRKRMYSILEPEEIEKKMGRFLKEW